MIAKGFPPKTGPELVDMIEEVSENLIYRYRRDDSVLKLSAAEGLVLVAYIRKLQEAIDTTK